MQWNIGRSRLRSAPLANLGASWRSVNTYNRRLFDAVVCGVRQSPSLPPFRNKIPLQAILPISL